MSDLYTEFTQNLPLPGAMENIKKGGNQLMGYSKKAKAAEANAEEMIKAEEIIITRANEIKENVVMFDIQLRGITIYGMCMRHYKNKKGEEGDMISFPARPSDKKDENGNIIYYNHCFFKISKELKDSIVEKVIDKLNE